MYAFNIHAHINTHPSKPCPPPILNRQMLTLSSCTRCTKVDMYKTYSYIRVMHTSIHNTYN